jgi:two-component system chemotaxis sensor kinase CheA
LAIIPALVVECKEHRYAIPQISLLELVRLEGDAARHGVEHIHGSPVYRLRGELLPLVFLQSELWQLPEQRFDEMTDPVVNIVILQADGHVFGLVVDGVQDTVEIVVKPLSKHLKGISCFAGATILGDGKVGLILDVMGIAQKAHVFSGVRERVRSEQVLQEHDTSELETLLLCRSPDDGRLAIPLSLVARLEEFPRGTLERVGEQDVVQYRGQILPLITIHDVLPERRVRYRRSEEELLEENLQVVVHNHHNKSIGLVVDRILDITRENLDLQRPASRAGVRGCLVIQEKVTELLDLHAVIRAGNPTFFQAEER